MDALRKTDATMDPWMSLLAASVRLKETRFRIKTRILNGEITGQVVAGRTVVLREDVERIAEAKDAQ